MILGSTCVCIMYAYIGNTPVSIADLVDTAMLYGS